MPEIWEVLPARGEAMAPYWSTDAFRDELHAWCEAHLGPLVSLEQSKLRGWSTVWRATTAEGLFWVKQNCPLQNFEVTLLPALADLVPDHVVPVAAAADGVLATPDQGPVFAQTSGDSLEPWERLVREAAEMQRVLCGHQGRLVDAGVTALPVDRSVDYVRARTDQLASLPEADPRRLDTDIARRLEAHLPVVRRWAEQVTALGLPDTLDHNDLHGNNCFDIGGRLRFFDFGDAVLTGPLSVLRIPLNHVAIALDCPADDPRLLAVAEPALEVWSDLAPMSELRAALPAALHLGRLGRTESWLRCLPAFTDAELAEWGDSPAYWLGALLDGEPFKRG